MYKYDVRKKIRPLMSYLASLIGFLIITLIPIMFMWGAVGGGARPFIEWIAQFANVVPESLANTPAICELAKKNPHCNKNKCAFVKDWFTSEQCSGATLDAKHFDPNRKGGSKVKSSYIDPESKEDFKHVAKFAHTNIPCNRTVEAAISAAPFGHNALNKVENTDNCQPTTEISCEKAMAKLKEDRCGREGPKLECPYVNGVTKQQDYGKHWYLVYIGATDDAAQIEFLVKGYTSLNLNATNMAGFNLALQFRNDSLGVGQRKIISVNTSLPATTPESTAVRVGKLIWKIVPMSRVKECGRGGPELSDRADDTYAKRNINVFSNCKEWMLHKPIVKDQQCEDYIKNNASCAAVKEVMKNGALNTTYKITQDNGNIMNHDYRHTGGARNTNIVPATTDESCKFDDCSDWLLTKPDTKDTVCENYMLSNASCKTAREIMISGTRSGERLQDHPLGSGRNHDYAHKVDGTGDEKKATTGQSCRFAKCKDWLPSMPEQKDGKCDEYIEHNASCESIKKVMKNGTTDPTDNYTHDSGRKTDLVSYKHPTAPSAFPPANKNCRFNCTDWTSGNVVPSTVCSNYVANNLTCSQAIHKVNDSTESCAGPLT